MKVGIFYEHNQTLRGIEVDETTHTITDEHETSVVGLSDQTIPAIQKALMDFDAWLVSKLKAGTPVFWQLPQLSTGSSIPGDQTGLMEAKPTTIALQAIYKRHKDQIDIKRDLSLNEAQKNIVRITFLRRNDADVRAILIAYDATGGSMKGKKGLLKVFEATPQYQQARLLIATFATPANKGKLTFANYVNTIERFESSNGNVVKLKQALGTKLKGIQDHVDLVKPALGL